MFAWRERHPKLWTAIGLLLVGIPGAIQVWWSLVSAEPLIPTLLEHMPVSIALPTLNIVLIVPILALPFGILVIVQGVVIQRLQDFPIDLDIRVQSHSFDPSLPANDNLNFALRRDSFDSLGRTRKGSPCYVSYSDGKAEGFFMAEIRILNRSLHRAVRILGLSLSIRDHRTPLTGSEGIPMKITGLPTGGTFLEPQSHPLILHGTAFFDVELDRSPSNAELILQIEHAGPEKAVMHRLCDVDLI